jgi:hypothetical protein
MKMSAINVASSSIVPAALASGATAGAAGGATSLAVQTLPTTGTGMTLLIVVMAITFILVGALLLWNPLNRRQAGVRISAGSPNTAADSTLGHLAHSG